MEHWGPLLQLQSTLLPSSSKIRPYSYMDTYISYLFYSYGPTTVSEILALNDCFC